MKGSLGASYLRPQANSRRNVARPNLKVYKAQGDNRGQE